MKVRSSAILAFLASAIAASTLSAEEKSALVLARAYEFRVPGYSLRYILPKGEYRRVQTDREAVFYDANAFIRREEFYRETAFSGRLLHGGLIVTRREPRTIEMYLHGPAHSLIRYTLPEDFARGYGQLWDFAR